MRCSLHPYQERCVSWLKARDGALLLLDMGLGKTLIALTALADLKACGEAPGPALVIAPLATARHVWAQEAARWDHTSWLSVAVACGTETEREEALAAAADVVVTNREQVPWLASRYGRARWPFGTVIVDEASSFKNARSKRFRALRAVRPAISRLWALTGTPAPNGLMDLWAEAWLADRGERLGRTIGAYRERWFSPGRRSGHVVYDWRPRPGAADEIEEALSDIAISMRAADELDLPPRTVNDVQVVLPPAAMAGYRRFASERFAELAGAEVTAQSAAACVGKLQQWADGVVYDDAGGARAVHRAKLDALRAVVDEAQGQPVLVFYAYRSEADEIMGALPEAELLDPAGDAPERWNRGEVPVLLAHPAACGHGLNLQEGGHIAVWYGLTWSLELYQQANARLDRQGQRSPVIVHRLMARGTADEAIAAALEGKATLQDSVTAALRERGESDGSD